MNDLVCINVGHLSPQAIKLFDATNRRVEEVYNEEGVPLTPYGDLLPIILGQCLQLWPRMSRKRAIELCDEVFEAYRRALALAAQPAAGEG